MKMVSVVIPAYNRSDKIIKAIKSVQDQSYKNWEIVVVNDGSTDDTAEVVARCAREDSRIRLVRHEYNRGAQAARNTGIRAAQGEWIAFLDSDDQWLYESLELRLKVAHREKVSVVHSDCLVMGGDGQMKLYHPSGVQGCAYKELIMHEGPMLQGLLASKKALERIGYLDEGVLSFQEWDTAIRLAKYYSFGFEARPTFIYDDRETDSIPRISKNAMAQAFGYHYIIKKHMLAILWQAGPYTLGNHYEIAERLYRTGGDQVRARHCSLMSFVCKFPRRASNKLRRIIIKRG